MLEALLKRVDGLEQKLKDQKNSESSLGTEEAALAATETISNAESTETAASASASTAERSPKRQEIEASQPKEVTGESAVYSPPAENEPSPGVQTDALLDTYFTCFHAKPFYILDESSVRQRLQLNQLPVYLIHAIYSVAARSEMIYHTKLPQKPVLTNLQLYATPERLSIRCEAGRGLRDTCQGRDQH